MGSNYVLGTREEDNVYEPLRVHPKQFHENQVHVVGAGAMHIAVLTSASTDAASTLPPLTTGTLLTSRADLGLQAVKEEPEEEKKEGTGTPAIKVGDIDAAAA